MVYSDNSNLDLFDEIIRIKNFRFGRKVVMKKLLKITEIATLPKSAQFPYYQRYLFHILMKQIKENLNKDYVNISRPYLLYFPINQPSKNVTVGPGWVGSGHS